MRAGGPETSPLKPLPSGSGLAPLGGPPLPGCEGGGHPQRQPSSWTRGELVGQGAFGSVFVAMDNDTGELVAVKQVGAGCVGLLRERAAAGKSFGVAAAAEQLGRNGWLV